VIVQSARASNRHRTTLRARTPGGRVS